ncbi:MAG TPA: hypothetical protein VNX18_18295 [Bryobacteraceae bacterium]|nr:hypothetical protein [Bryobacteraceae bacterium]
MHRVGRDWMESSAPIRAVWRWFAFLVFAANVTQAQSDFLNHNRPVLDSHNCYPYEGRWTNRIDRALSTGFPVAIEQDIAWANGRPVVSHTSKTTGSEPALRDHFFERVRPIVEKALAQNDRASWPLIILHFDFKTLDPQTIRAVWGLLGEYEAWITTAPQTSDPHVLAPFDKKPLLVLTEDADEQEEVFFKSLPKGARLRVFGSAHTEKIEAKSREERAHLLATLPPEKLLAEKPTNYRRWWNNSWTEVEEGGQTRAGDWTADDDRRLRALVNRAHDLGYWIRFYTLDGFTEETNRGWDKGYNFGSREAALARWKAAFEAGVNLIATDQYEDLAAFLAGARKNVAADHPDQARK